jgi:hypothetical protein
MERAMAEVVETVQAMLTEERGERSCRPGLPE